MILNMYLKCLRNKGMTIKEEIVKLLHSTNAILQRIVYIVLTKLRRRANVE